MSKYLDQDGLLYLWKKLKTLFAGKVDKVSGKGLSTNDYTTAEKTKLAGIDEEANNYTLPNATTSVKGGVIVGSGISVNNATISVPNMTAATASAAGKAGLVPAPAANKHTSFLRGDGTWVVPTNTDSKVNVTLATTTKAYLLATSTTPTSTAAAVTALSDTGVYLDTTAGKLTAGSFAGNGAGLTSLNASNISDGTIAAARLPAASTSAQGAMSAADKTKLDGITTMTGASSSADGASGLVPAPTKGNQGKFLRADGTWATPTDNNTDTKVNVTLGTTTKAFLLGTSTTPTSTAAGVTAIADTGVYLDTTAGKLTAGSFAGNGAALTALNASNISDGTIAAARLPAASTSAQGAMSAADKTKLDGITSMSGATSSAAGKTGLVPAPAAGAQAKFLRGDGTWQVPTDTNTDTKVNVTLGTTSKAFLLGTTTTPTSTAAGVTAIADTGVYLDTTAGKLTAGSFSGNGSALTSLNASNISSGTIGSSYLPAASTSAQGAMSAADKTKLDGITTMTAASANAAGTTGLVPAPAAGAQGKFLRGDGTWQTPTDTNTKVNVTLGTTTKAFLLGTSTTPTSTATGVTAIADTGVYLDTTAGKLTATSFSGNGSALTSLNASNISSGTIGASYLPAASTSAQGAMSATDKAKLDGITTMTGASSSADGASGLVPQPTKGNQAKFLRADGTWATPTDTNTDTKVNVTLATTSKAYLLATTTTPTATAAGVTAVSDTGVYLDTTAGKLTATSFAGNGSALTSLNASNLGSGTVPAARLPAASTSAQGAMSAADKTKLDGITVMTAATASAAGTQGLVPAPAAGNQGKFLRGDGTWQTPTDTNTDTKVNVTLATTSKAFLLATTTTPTSTAAGVTAVSDTGVYLDTTAGKLTATSFAGNGASLTNLAAGNIATGTIAAARLPAASTSAQGAMSAADKSKLDGMGASNSTSKLFLMGGTSQANPATTYSNQYVHETNGALSAASMGINASTAANKVTLQWNSTTSSLDFVFA